MKTFQPRGYSRYEVAKSDCNQRCYPGAIIVIFRERRPAPVWILRIEKKSVTMVLDVCGLGPKRKHRIACWLQCGLSRGSERGPTSARKLSTNKFGGQVAGNHRDSSPPALVERIVFIVKTLRDSGFSGSES